MEAEVDPSICIGCGLCAEICPDVFVLEGDVAVVTTTVVPPDMEETCREACEACPVAAISLE